MFPLFSLEEFLRVVCDVAVGNFTASESLIALVKSSKPDPEIATGHNWSALWEAHEATFKGYTRNAGPEGGAGSDLLPILDDNPRMKTQDYNTGFAYDAGAAGDVGPQTIRYVVWLGKPEADGEYVVIRWWRLPTDKVFSGNGDSLSLTLSIFDINVEDVGT